jgi:hypothetical protein
LRIELVTERDQLRAKFGVVVDLAVEDHPDGRVFVVNRLLAGGDVDNREAPHPQGHARHDEAPLVIRTAVTDCGAHRAEHRTVSSSILVAGVPAARDMSVRKTRYSAHIVRFVLSFADRAGLSP